MDSNYTIELNSFNDLSIKNYIYKLFKQELSNDKITIMNVIGFSDYTAPAPHLPNININSKNGSIIFSDNLMIYSILYENEPYELCFQNVHEMNYIIDISELKHRLFVGGKSFKANKFSELCEFLIKESYKNMNFLKKILKYVSYSGLFEIQNIEEINLPKISLDELFISSIKRKQLSRFIYTVKNYEKLKMNLRYLLSGAPGTGKTELINAILNNVKGCATVFFAFGKDLPLKEMFEFCHLFEPCILVLDDLDLLISERENILQKDKLGEFLQYLDGLMPSNVFLLATTNDKRLVDIAASRPGRIDMILDVSEINSGDYLRLIKRETNDEEIINLFTQEILYNFEVKKVTGAFIVNLLKQLSLAKRMDGKLDTEDLNIYFDLTYKGFYGSNSDSLIRAVGF